MLLEYGILNFFWEKFGLNKEALYRTDAKWVKKMISIANIKSSVSSS